MDVDEVVEHIQVRRESAPHTLVVGISGYGGSGKSTLARALVSAVPGAVRMRGDDFLDPTRSHRRSSHWDGVDRDRLVGEVLAPLRSGRGGEFRRFDWSTRSLGRPEALPRAEVLVVDLIGLFHPESLPDIDVSIWCDVDLDVATQRGMDRDARLGRRHVELWRDVWVPNEIDFAERFSPRGQAQLLYSPEPSCSPAQSVGSAGPE